MQSFFDLEDERQCNVRPFWSMKPENKQSMPFFHFSLLKSRLRLAVERNDFFILLHAASSIRTELGSRNQR